jgi:ribosomal protein S12 methylthiotransferase accessory factor
MTVPTRGRRDVQSGLGALTDLDQLVGPFGLVSRTNRLSGHPGEADFSIFSASLGNLAEIIPNVRVSGNGRDVRGEMDGAGGALEAERASRLCVAEALERYSSCWVQQDAMTWATARELGEDTVRLLETMPRMSAAELAHPKAMATTVAPDEPIRWVRGWSLTGARPVWIPAVQVWMHIPAQSRAERAWNPISTGCATHSDLHQALVNGLCEVVERDAIALTWYLRIPLPRIEFDDIVPELQPFWQRQQDSDVTKLFFDATTDLGIPTIYSLDLADHNDVLSQLVMCNAGLDPVDSVAKIIRESASSRIAMQTPRETPSTVDDFLHVHHGAAYLGGPERRAAFDFLELSPKRAPFRSIPNLSTGNPGSDLGVLVDRIAEAGYEVLAVDCTTEEAERVGFHVVRVLIPGLMPLSFAHRARHLGHPRWRSAARRMGLGEVSESDLNPLPQPFA